MNKITLFFNTNDNTIPKVIKYSLSQLQNDSFQSEISTCLKFELKAGLFRKW